MTDRELLELAAKAAGIKGETMFVEELGAWLVLPDFKEWSPITDDGDALRLAVSLQIDIDFPEDGVVFADGNWSEFVGQDRCAATRRAIVRAAAEIGKAM